MPSHGLKIKANEKVDLTVQVNIDAQRLANEQRYEGESLWVSKLLVGKLKNSELMFSHIVNANIV